VGTAHRCSKGTDMKDLSFIIGSGFSIPARYPPTKELNEKLRKIDASEIDIYSNGDACFRGNEENPNAWFEGKEEKAFIQEFLEFYNHNIIGSPELFNYELFYDYYQELLQSEDYPQSAQQFFKKFRQHHEVYGDDHNLLLRFHNSFSQLLAQILNRPHKLAYMGKPKRSPHSRFLDLLEKLAKTYKIHFHSLNHDLYLEHLARSDAMNNDLDTGFEELGSPFYGEVWDDTERYKVRLEWFTNKYDNRFNLYKLHGGINHYRFRTSGAKCIIKKKSRVSPRGLFMEVNKNGELEYIDDPSNYYPDFLIGSTSKIERYNEYEYYQPVFQRFEENLRASKTLIIIGYGFGDTEINKYIAQWVASDGSKRAFVVDVKKPETEIFKHSNVFFDDGGVEGMDINFIIKNIA